MIVSCSCWEPYPALNRRGFFFWGDEADNVDPLQDDAQVISRCPLAIALGPVNRRLDAGRRL